MDNFDPEGQRFFFQMLKEWNSTSFFKIDHVTSYDHCQEICTVINISNLKFQRFPGFSIETNQGLGQRYFSVLIA